jgi:hypothetical protein
MVVFKHFLRFIAYIWLLWGTFSAVLVACLIVSIVGIKLFLASLNLPIEADSGDPLGYSAIFFVPCGVASVGMALLASIITAVFLKRRLFSNRQADTPTS